MKIKHIIIFLIVVLLVLFFTQQKEHLSSKTPNLSSEAVQNIAKVYADTKESAYFNNINTTGNMRGNVIGNVTGNLKGDVTGNIVSTQATTSRLCIGQTCIDETDLKKISSNKKCAGFAIDAEGSTMLLYEGYWELFDYNENQRRFDAWTNNKWDRVYIFKGWKIQFFEDGNRTGSVGIVENKTDDIPKSVDVSKTADLSNISNETLRQITSNLITKMPNSISSYEATWVGY